jgi:hypothetical protein
VRTGGFVGVRQSVLIRRDGRWAYRDERFGDAQQGRLTRWQLRTLDRLVSHPRLGWTPPDRPTCADVFHYAVLAGRLRNAFTDCADPRGPVVDLVRYVVRVTAL